MEWWAAILIVLVGILIVFMVSCVWVALIFGNRVERRLGNVDSDSKPSDKLPD